MGAYKRDYLTLTEEEKKEYERIKAKEKMDEDGKPLFLGRRNLFREYPKAARHYESLFPNYYLDAVELKDEKYLNDKIKEFENLLDNNSNEQEILKFIKTNESYYIIASILMENYRFGHHEAYIMPEFKLGTSYRVDYLLVGKSSGGYEFVFVELEHPNKKSTKKNGWLSEVFRKGIEQTKEWEIWLEQNYSNLREWFGRNIKNNDKLPNEFIGYDPSRFHYAVVAGRQNDFDDTTYRLRRDYIKEKRTLLLHYDNLVNYSKEIIGKQTY